MAKADPEAKGAFVNCLVGGDSPEAAAEVLHSTLEIDGYELVSVGQISEFEVYRTKGNVSEEMEQEAGRIRRKGGIWYSPFHCFRDSSAGISQGS
jgi:predicted dinucleotide-binding enzyme